MFSTPFTFLKSSAAAPSFFLDVYPGANRAYSISRRLATSYTGPLIRITRTSDSTQTDIGYDVNGVLDTAEILSFVSGGTAYVQKVYDQSGNGDDATTIGGGLAYIVEGGTIVEKDSIPCSYRLVGANQAFASTSSFNAKTILSVYQREGGGSINYLTFNTHQPAPNQGIYAGNGYGTLGFGIFANPTIINTTDGQDTNRHIGFLSLDGSGNVQLAIDGNSLDNAVAGINDLAVADVMGRRMFSLSLNGWNFEQIFYPNDESANYAGMIAEMQKFY